MGQRPRETGHRCQNGVARDILNPPAADCDMRLLNAVHQECLLETRWLGFSWGPACKPSLGTTNPNSGLPEERRCSAQATLFVQMEWTGGPSYLRMVGTFLKPRLLGAT